MVCCREGQVEVFPVGGEIGVDSDCVTGFGTEVVEELSDTLGAGDGIGAEGVDNPDLAEGDGCGDCGAVFVAGDEFHVLDSSAL